MPSNHAQIAVSLRQLLASARMEEAVREKLFPHLHHEPDQEDPFNPTDDEQIARGWIHAALEIQTDLNDILTASRGIPKPYDEMFCFIAYRDLRKRMRMYEELAERLSATGAEPVSAAA